MSLLTAFYTVSYLPKRMVSVVSSLFEKRGGNQRKMFLANFQQVKLSCGQ